MERTTVILEHFYGVRLTHVKGRILPSFWGDVPHSHEHCEIFVHLAGLLDVFVEQNRYRLSGGEVRVYRSGELHHGKTDAPQDMEWYQLSIPQGFFLREENKALAPVLFAREAGEGNVFSSAAGEEMTALLVEALAAHRKGSALWQHYAESAVRRILCLLNEPQKNRSVSSRQNRIMGQILDTINTEFRQISTVHQLCERTHYSMSYVNRIFKAYMGVTPYQFLVAKKLNEAKKALIGGCSVTEACEYAGFNNYNNFITLFHKTFGKTPKQFRSGQR